MDADINTEELIPLVRDRPVLWDRTLEDYKTKSLKVEAWREIYCILKPDFMDLDVRQKTEFGKLVSNRWYNVRDAFVRAKKKEVKTKTGFRTYRPYIYAKQLKFLTKVIMPWNPMFVTNLQQLQQQQLQQQQSKQEEDDDDDEEQYASSSSTSSPSFSPRPSIPPAKMSKFLDLKLHEDSISSYDDDSPHLSFFKGILPSISTFNEDETLELQSEILATIQKIRRKRQQF